MLVRSPNESGPTIFRVWGIALFGRWPDAGDGSDFAVADESLAVATAKRRDLACPCVDGHGVPAFCMDL